MIHQLHQNVSRYNVDMEEVCVKVAFQQTQPVVAFCTPLMRRVHQLWRYSAEMAFVDSSGCMDRSNCRVFVLLTHSPAGGLPLGVFITPSESEEVIKFGLETLKEVLPKDAFYGRGSDGPKVIMTDDSQAERSAIHTVWPTCIRLLCVFHVLQAVWRWLWEKRHGIAHAHRPHLLTLLKRVMYAETVEDAELNYAILQADTDAMMYPNYLVYIGHLFARKDEWMVSSRREMIVRYC